MGELSTTSRVPVTYRYSASFYSGTCSVRRHCRSTLTPRSVSSSSFQYGVGLAGELVVYILLLSFSLGRCGSVSCGGVLVYYYYFVGVLLSSIVHFDTLSICLMHTFMLVIRCCLSVPFILVHFSGHIFWTLLFSSLWCLLSHLILAAAPLALLSSFAYSCLYKSRG